MSSTETIITDSTTRLGMPANFTMIASNAQSKGDFDPTKHLAYQPPAKVLTMRDLQLPEGHGISPVAVSEPFQLFTQEAIERMREEIMSQEVLDNCQISSNMAKCQIRNYAAKYAPFVYDVWKHPETLAIVSKIAGVDLVTAMDLDIAHVNLNFKPGVMSKEETLAAIVKAQEESKNSKPIVDWHTDSYPFVCVTMLSDCTNMVGGETALRTGTGEIMKVRGPQMGCAVVLQGRYIEHQALQALGATERISMVTSFRPRSANMRDDTVLGTIRPITDLSELYYEYSEYRFEILEERLRNRLREQREARKAGKKIRTSSLKEFIAEQERFLAHMNREILPEDQVTMGFVDASQMIRRVQSV